MASDVMAGLWPLRLRSLHAGFCAGERVMGVNQSTSGFRRDDRVLVIASKVLMCRFLGWRTRYGRKGGLVASGVMAENFGHCDWTLHADFCAGERVKGGVLSNQQKSRNQSFHAVTCHNRQYPHNHNDSSFNIKLPRYLNSESLSALTYNSLFDLAKPFLLQFSNRSVCLQRLQSRVNLPS